MNLFSKRILIILVFMGLLLASFVGYILYDKETKEIKIGLKQNLNDKVLSLEREYLLNFETLYSIKGLFVASNFVSSKEFKVMTEGILSRHKSIQALEWIPKITNKQRLDYENDRKKEFVNFEITQKQAQNKMIRAKEKEFYFPVSYVEPFIGNELALGFDLSSSKKRLKTLMQSISSGELLSSESISLVQDKTKQKAFLTFMPIYTDNFNDKTKESIKGFVLGVFKLSDMFKASMGEVKNSGINLLFFDKTDSKNDILYSNFNYKKVDIPAKYFYEKKLIPLGGRDLVLKAFATRYYIQQKRTLIPYFVSILSMIFILLGAFYTYSVFNKKDLIERLVKIRTKELDDLNKKLHLLSRTDSLTKIANRRYFDEYLHAQFKRAIRDKTPISLIMIDIDYFKLYNDNYGHIEGDECLKKVAKILKNTIKRDSDLIARFGGEEFIIVLPNTDNTELLANKCLENILKSGIKHEFSKISNYLTISIGTTTVLPESKHKLQTFLENVDKALYEAKQTGRNKICHI